MSFPATSQPPSPPGLSLPSLAAGMAATALAVSGGWWLGMRHFIPVPEVSVSMTVPTGRSTLPAVPESLATQLSKIRQGPKGFARRRALLELRDRARTPQELRGLLDTGDLGSMTDTLLIRWTEQDPAGAWAWLKAGGPPGSGFSSSQLNLFQMRALPVLFETWFKKDPDAAFKAARLAGRIQWTFAAAGILKLTFSDEAHVRKAVAAHLDELSASGSGNSAVFLLPADEVTAKIAALPPSKGKDLLVEQLGARRFGENWEEAVKWADTLPPEQKVRLLGKMAESAVATMKAFAGQSRGEEIPQASLDRAAAAFTWARQWLETEAPAVEKQRLSATVVESLAATDPTGAMAWAQANLKGLTLAAAVGNVLATRAAQDPAAAVTLLESLPPGTVRSQSAAKLAENWGYTDAPAALAWISSEADSNTAASVGGLISSQWAIRDPEGVKTWISENQTANLPGRILDPALQVLLRKDAGGMLDWALTLKAGDLRDQAVHQSFAASIQNDPAAAGQQLSRSPELLQSDNRVRSLTYAWFARDPAAAIDWARQLPLGARAAAGEAVTQALEQNSQLPLEQKAALQARLTTGKPVN